MFFERFILAARARNGRNPTIHCIVLDWFFWIARAGALWRGPLPGRRSGKAKSAERRPEEFGKWSRAYRQVRRWTLAGLWQQIIDALNQSRAVPDALQMTDRKVIRAHHPLPDRCLPRNQ